MIRPGKPDDAAQICTIYNWYVLNTTVTFEEVEVSVAEMQGRIAKASELRPWYVCEEDGNLLGYAYAGEWKSRCSYRHTVETTVYLDHALQKKGLGTNLYQQLISALEMTPVHALIAGIALPNPASVALHEKMGFRKVGHFAEVGWKFEQWVDVGYWQLSLPPRMDSVN